MPQEVDEPSVGTVELAAGESPDRIHTVESVQALQPVLGTDR